MTIIQRHVKTVPKCISDWLRLTTTFIGMPCIYSPDKLETNYSKVKSLPSFVSREKINNLSLFPRSPVIKVNLEEASKKRRSLSILRKQLILFPFIAKNVKKFKLCLEDLY